MVKSAIHHTVLALCAFMIASCAKPAPSQGNAGMYMDMIALGTGMNPVSKELTGETATFSLKNGPVGMFWMIESEHDMDLSPVMLRIERKTSTGYQPFDAITLSSPRGFGHRCACGPYMIAEAGTYRATGITVDNGYTVASAEFTVD